MSSKHSLSTTSTATAAESIDLMPYLNGVIDARWWILAATVVATLLAAGWALSKPYMYESSVKISVVNIEDPGGVSPDDRRAAEVLTLVEHGFVMGTTRDNYDEVMLARLRSRDFTMRFIDEGNLYRHFYPQHWNAETEQWLPGFSPDRGATFTRFRDEVRKIHHDELTDIITISMHWPDAALARDWANQYVATFNEFIREKTLREVDRKLAFLDLQLRSSDVLDIQQSIYRLIEAQTAIAMLASAREEYALEVIDPAAMPYRSFNTSRKFKTIVGGIVGALLALFAVLASVLIRNMLETLAAHRKYYLEQRNSAVPAISTSKGDN